MADERLKLGKPQGDPRRLEYPDPLPGAGGGSGRPNAGRVHRRPVEKEHQVEEQVEPEANEPPQANSD